MRVAVIVFLFLARVWFPKSKSIAEVIPARYNKNTFKRIRKLEKLDYRLRKAELDLEFLCKCNDNNVIPKFLNFRVANNHLKFSTTYKQCQSNLLREEIRQKKSTVRILQKEFTCLKASLQNVLNLIDFAHVSTLFLGINEILKSKSLVVKTIVHMQKSMSNLLFQFRGYDNFNFGSEAMINSISFKF